MPYTLNNSVDRYISFNWVAVKEVSLSYYIGGTILSTIYPGMVA